MTRYDEGLVVDGSRVARHLLRLSLGAHCKRVGTRESIEDANGWLDGADARALLVVDSALEGFAPLLETLARSDARPAFLVVSARPGLEDELRATLAGAIGYLPKPISRRTLSAAILAADDGFTHAPPRARSGPFAEVEVADPVSGEAQLVCEVMDLSEGGAFLAAPGPIPAGTRLQLRLRLDGGPVRVAARVRRVQEPTWEATPGWGVSIEHDDANSRSALARFVAQNLDPRRRWVG